TVNNVAPKLDNVTVTSPVKATEDATLEGFIVDPGTQDTFTLVVDWGDGSDPETFSYPAGTTDFSKTHAYHRVPGGPELLHYTISLTLTDDDTGTTSTTVPVTVL